MKPRIFISAVTSELQAARDLVAKTLLALGYEPVWQDIFGTEAGDLRKILRDQIDSCSGLIQIIGDAYGAEPQLPDPAFGRVSYTQYEFLYAHQSQKTTWLFFTTLGCTRDTPRETTERQQLQQTYRARIEAGGHLWYPVTTNDQLRLRIHEIKNELAVLRGRFGLWQKGMLALLLMVAVGVIGIWWAVDRLRSKFEQQPRQIAQQIQETLPSEIVEEVVQRISEKHGSPDDLRKQLENQISGKTPDQTALSATLVLRVWSANREPRGRIGLGTDNDALPVAESDRVAAEVTFNEPAYAYLFWIDGTGAVTPLYPWNVDDLQTKSVERPPELGRVTQLRNPATDGVAWEVDNTPGLDTILLLARREPWPAKQSMTEVIGTMPKAPMTNAHEVVIRGWDRARELQLVAQWDRNRGPKGIARTADDQLQSVVNRMRGEFEVIRAVRFAHVLTQK